MDERREEEEEENGHGIGIEIEGSKDFLERNNSGFSDKDWTPSIREPLLRSRINNTSQIAIVGANLCPIESLDYEIVENDLFKQDWRSRKKVEIFRLSSPSFELYA